MRSRRTKADDANAALRVATLSGKSDTSASQITAWRVSDSRTLALCVCLCVRRRIICLWCACEGRGAMGILGIFSLCVYRRHGQAEHTGEGSLFFFFWCFTAKNKKKKKATHTKLNTSSRTTRSTLAGFVPEPPFFKGELRFC